MKTRCFAFCTDAVFMLALTLVLTVCRVPMEKGIIINFRAEGVSSGDIDKVINNVIARGSGNDGSTPDKPLNLIINGLDFDNTLDMMNISNILQKYYVNLTLFGPHSGRTFNAFPLPDVLDKSKIISITLRGEVTEIGRGAFSGWTGLTTVNFPYVTSVGMDAFYNCTGLKTINLPAAIYIGDRAFQNCTSLETISLPITNFIGDSTFYGCINLTRVEFPAVQFLGCQAFSHTGNKAIELVFTLLYPPKFVDASGAKITTGINLFDGSFGKQVVVNAPAYFGNYEAWGKKNGTDTEKAVIWGDGITVIYASH